MEQSSQSGGRVWLIFIFNTEIYVMNYCTFLLLVLTANVMAHPNGAPLQACKTMVPGHGFDPQTRRSPFTVTPLMVITLICSL